MKGDFGGRRKKHKLSLLQSAIVAPLIGLVITTSMGMLFFRDVSVIQDHLTVRAEVVSVTKRHSYRSRTKNRVDLSYTIDGMAYHMRYSRPLYAKPPIEKGEYIQVAVNQQWPDYAIEMRNDWEMRLWTGWAMGLLVAGVIDVIAVLAIRKYLKSKRTVL